MRELEVAECRCDELSTDNLKVSFRNIDTLILVAIVPYPSLGLV